ncbi:MAG: HK97 family phage prohead protease [Clostridia bacterium]|nr:HK97 family phage prohead protease [Clostridia bacterium]
MPNMKKLAALEMRMFPAKMEARAEGDTGTIKGRPIVYNSQTDIGWFDEIIMPGALDGADLNDVRLCLNHDTSYVYARSRRNNARSTMRLFPNESGMDIEADLAIGSSPRAQDYYTAVERGDIDKMSFMFSVEADEWENLESDHPLRRIKKIGTVVEVSAVTFPAYEATSVEIDARSKEALDNARSALESARQQMAKPSEDGLELAKAKINLM